MERLTNSTLRILYHECNIKYFNGILAHCEVCVFNDYTRIAFYNKSIRKNKVYGKIYINKNVEWTDESLKNVLIHEMIHHYVAQVDKRYSFDDLTWYGLFGHGFHFRRQCRRIKKNYGVNVNIHGGDVRTKAQKKPTTFFGKLLEFIESRLF